MTKTMNITGMGCPRCSARLKAALEALEQVSSADVNHETGIALLALNAPVEDAALRAAVEQYDGFAVTGIA